MSINFIFLLLLTANERIVYKFDIPSESIIPIGLTIDALGFLYSGLNGGGAVVKIDPR